MNFCFHNTTGDYEKDQESPGYSLYWSHMQDSSNQHVMIFQQRYSCADPGSGLETISNNFWQLVFAFRSGIQSHAIVNLIDSTQDVFQSPKKGPRVVEE